MGLSRSSLRTKLAFKGGTALKRCHFEDYRFSEDMGFTLLEAGTTLEIIKKEMESIYTEVKSASGITFRFVRDDQQSHQNCYTFYLRYEGPLPITTTGKEIKVDITIREQLVHPPGDHTVLKSYREYTDLPQGATIQAYSLN